MNMMCLNRATAALARHAAAVAVVSASLFCIPSLQAGAAQTVTVHAVAGVQLGSNTSAADGTNHWQLALDAVDSTSTPFSALVVKQGTKAAQYGPNPGNPYFTARFALPVPPENLTNNFAAMTGMNPWVYTHNHSPGFVILPNGDALAIYFSTPPGKSESDPQTSFIVARLRYGSEEWDLPELFFKTEGFNDQSGLLWNDHGKIWFFGGGRDWSDYVPFKLATSTDNGATWTLALPQLAAPAHSYTAQPITSAFRASDNSIYFAMDGEKETSFLWHSTDEGIHWQQMAGRTGGRHSTMVPTGEDGHLFSIGGKNASVNGWSPQNFSTDWGASWTTNAPSPFPPLGSAQRPSLIKLADGNLFFVSDAYLHKLNRLPPAGWQFGNGCFVALSKDNGATWRIKSLPVQVPNHERGTNGTLGYVTARQAPNGVIQVLSTETQPCLHYEMNEAWILSDAADIAPENSGGTVKNFSEHYANGKLRSEWSARICPNGRYLLDGQQIDYYEDGVRQHVVNYQAGRKTGKETCWAENGATLWIWTHDLKTNHSVWQQYWANGHKKFESTWNTRPMARDLARSFFGLVADGPARRWDQAGKLEFAGNFSNGLLVNTGTN